MQGLFAPTHFGALQRILRSWGSCLTWTAQRVHASQIVRGLQAFYDSATFVMTWEGGADLGGGKSALLRALIYIGDPNKKLSTHYGVLCLLFVTIHPYNTILVYMYVLQFM